MTERSHHPELTPRSLRVALTAVTAAALGALLGLLVIGSLAATRRVDVSVTDPSNAMLAQLMTDQGCSFEGFGASTIPASALVRTPSGVVEVVSFDHGWGVYQGRAPGTLIAVCLRASGVVQDVPDLSGNHDSRSRKVSNRRAARGEESPSQRLKRDTAADAHPTLVGRST